LNNRLSVVQASPEKRDKRTKLLRLSPQFSQIIKAALFVPQFIQKGLSQFCLASCKAKHKNVG